MNLEQKFAKGNISRTYQRIDADYNIDIFVGYNDNGQMSFVITEVGKEARVKSSKIINVFLKRREDNKMALTFDLVDNSYKSLFIIFCKDIINTCEKVGKDLAISNSILRWKYWKEMFGRRNLNILDKSEIKGLIGEMIELKDHFIKKYGTKVAVESWMGPLLGHKDFEISDTWYEIKTVSENALQLNISSFEQLESDVDGHLVVIRLEETSSTSVFSINLNSIVLSVVDMITDPDDLELLKTRLDSVGYMPNAEYDNYNYVYKGKTSYLINEHFPRLRRKDFDKTIGNIKYTIMIDGISDCEE